VNAKGQGDDLFILECPTPGVATFLAVDQLDPEEVGPANVEFIRENLRETDEILSESFEVQADSSRAQIEKLSMVP
jgi:hypothetical protein